MTVSKNDNRITAFGDRILGFFDGGFYLNGTFWRKGG